MVKTARLAKTCRVSFCSISWELYLLCRWICTQNSGYTDKLYAFDIVGKIWLSKASMNNRRTTFSMEAVGAKLVACGGKYSPNVEIYDIADDQWTLIQNGNLDHYSSSATIVLNDRVYVIGGYENGTKSWTDSVTSVDVDNGAVHRVCNLPFRVDDHACALLTVPNTAT